MTDQLENRSSAFFSRKNIQSLILLGSFVFAFRWSVASPYVVPTPSMEPSIKVGDRLLGNHLAYELRVPFSQIRLLQWGKPAKGDIIIFKSQTEKGINLVKRVVAISGDEVLFLDGVLYINDLVQNQSDRNEDRSVMSDMTDHPGDKFLFREDLAGKNHWILRDKTVFRQFRNWPQDGRPFKVPNDQVFVSGDNRDNSSDSRYWGTVPISDIYGRADRILWSAYSPAGALLPNLRLDRFGMALE